MTTTEDTIKLHPLFISVTVDGKKLHQQLFQQENIIVGRESHSDLYLPFEQVEAKQGLILQKDGKIFYKNLHDSSLTELSNDSTFKIGNIDIHIAIMPQVNVLIDNEITRDIVIQKATKDAPVQTKTIPTHKPSMPTSVAESIKQSPTQNVTHSKTFEKQKKVFTHTPVLETNFLPALTETHIQTAKSTKRKLEAVVTWHDQIYDVREFINRDSVLVGPLGQAHLAVPTYTAPWVLATYQGAQVSCFIPEGSKVILESKGANTNHQDLLTQKKLEPSNRGHKLTLQVDDVAHVELSHGIKIHLRQIPAPPELQEKAMMEPDAALKQALIGSAAVHLSLGFSLFISKPVPKNVPKLKDVPERFARLLVEKPKVIPTPKPTPRPTPPPVAKKEIKKIQVQKKVKAVVKHFKIPKTVAKVNKYPIEVKHPMPKAPPPVKVETLGALAALGPISKTAPTNVITNININKDAGGLPTKINTGGIVGALPSTNGKLMAGGSGAVKTKGMGFGTGTGYGIQGLKGLAGSRAVGGAVVGAPKLVSSGKKTEGLTRAQVLAVVQKHLGEIQHCYEKNLLSNPGLAGRMEFEWDISVAGSVTGVRIKKSSVAGGDGLGDCVKNVFSQMQFPKAINGETTTPTIGFPFGRL